MNVELFIGNLWPFLLIAGIAGAAAAVVCVVLWRAQH